MSAPIDLRDVRFRRDIERLHRLGRRAVGEMLAELAAARLLRTEIEALVARYTRLDPAALDAAGGRTWPR
jgi:hypothetical protein